MKKIVPLLIVTLLFSLFSCNAIKNETEAISKNDEGVQHLNEGNPDFAIEKFKKAVSLSSSKNMKSQYLRNLAIAFLDIDQVDSSRFYSLEAANLFSKKSINYLINMSDVHLIDGEVEKAIAKLERVIEKGGEGLETNNLLALIYCGSYGVEYQDLGKAILYSKKAYEINKDRVTEDVLARCYYEADELEEADFHFTRLAANYPYMLDYSYYLGLVKYEKGELNKAKELFRSVVQQDSLYYEGIEFIFEEE